jgi:hypothetical protein
MCFLQDAIGVFGYVDGCDEAVLAVRCGCERVRYGIDFGGLGGGIFRFFVGIVWWYWATGWLRRVRGCSSLWRRVFWKTGSRAGW